MYQHTNPDGSTIDIEVGDTVTATATGVSVTGRVSEIRPPRVSNDTALLIEHDVNRFMRLSVTRGYTVERLPLEEPQMGSVVIDREGYTYQRLVDGWYAPGLNGSLSWGHIEPDLARPNWLLVDGWRKGAAPSA